MNQLEMMAHEVNELRLKLKISSRVFSVWFEKFVQNDFRNIITSFEQMFNSIELFFYYYNKKKETTNKI